MRVLNRIGSDKYLHVICSLLLTFLIGRFAGIWLTVYVSALIGVVVAYDLGIIKEIYDRAHGGKIDKDDLWADFVGCVIGFIMLLL